MSPGDVFDALDVPAFSAVILFGLYKILQVLHEIKTELALGNQRMGIIEKNVADHTAMDEKQFKAVREEIKEIRAT